MKKKNILRVIGMVIVGMSVFAEREIGLWFIFPWIIGWQIYDFSSEELIG